MYLTKTNLQSEYLNDCHQISIVYKLLINIMKYGKGIESKYNEKKLYKENFPVEQQMIKLIF